ncbi:MAG: hypothetical protein ACRCTY_01725 [Candidatus Adiutrix sp.]
MLRSLIIDELIGWEIEAACAYIAQRTSPSPIENLYWLPLPVALWNDAQEQHQPEHQPEHDQTPPPYRLAIEIGAGWVRFELLVRGEGLLNLGGGPTDKAQTDFVFQWADGLVQHLEGLSGKPPTGAKRGA